MTKPMRYWTPEEDALLRQHWTAGMPLSWLSGQFGRKESAVSYRAMKIGLPSRSKHKPGEKYRVPSLPSLPPSKVLT